MSKTAIFIQLIALALTSCINSKRVNELKQTSPKFNVTNEINQYKDSLESIGVKSIVVVYYGCNGCISGVEEKGYLLWPKSTTTNNAMKITNYYTQADVVSIDDIYGTLHSNEDIILNMKKVEELELHSHNNYVLLNYYNNGEEIFSKQIFDFERSDSISKRELIGLIAKIESCLFQIESSNLKVGKGW